MGSCLSKKCASCSSASAIPEPPDPSKSNTDVEKKKKAEETTVKKEIFVIKHRKNHSHDFDRRSEEEKLGGNQKATCSNSITSATSEEIEIGNNGVSCNVMNGGLGNGSVIVRTSSCTKEEVDAILIQCGRLSRSSSTGKAASGGGSDNTSNPHRGGKYSGSKRSYDFDCDTEKGNEIEEGNYNDNGVGGDGMAAAERIHRHRQRQRQSRAGSSPSNGRRRTPSRERDQQQQEQQRSGSRERGGSGGGGGGRRVSRSPGRRSESPISTTNANASGTCTRPGKMVSVPATVSSLTMDKSNNGGGGGAEPLSGATIRRISVKRNAGAASPRSRSPARANAGVANDNQNAHFNQHLQQPLSLSRSNSRKAEHSPYRRTPLSEIDANVPPSHKSANNNNSNILLQTPVQKQMVENESNNKVVVQGFENKTSNGKGALDNVLTLDCKSREIVEEAKGNESLKPQILTRSRSSRRSRELDLNPEALLNPNPSYTALLLEDIQNFHQKNTTTTTTTTTMTFSLPPCVTKACSILEAVADLNSCTSSNLSCTLSDGKRSPMSQQFNKHSHKFSSGANPAGKRRLDTKDPFAESEVVADDLMEPSFHNYVTVRRGMVEEGDIEEQESSGSNSFVGGQQHWVSSSSWEPNSADSTNCWTASRSNASEDVRSQLGLRRHGFSESGCHTNEAQRRLSGKKREPDHHQIGIRRGRDGTGRGLHTMPSTAAAST
ncbi:uncharacterized protein At1g65710-like [Cornus florida]|uniref:uncharacterized protein At1g65710-like n=1 Tax=Cornus florida TaxID=4283 RepID=UPI00289EC7E5|nr:uncharacterized protein At1g65710-like [Cornus florida]